MSERAKQTKTLTLPEGGTISVTLEVNLFLLGDDVQRERFFRVIDAIKALEVVVTEAHKRAAIRPPERPRNRSVHQPRPGHDVEVTCWCERKVVDVPPEDVARGLTRSCGRTRCHGPTTKPEHADA